MTPKLTKLQAGVEATNALQGEEHSSVARMRAEGRRAPNGLNEAQDLVLPHSVS